MLIDEFTLDIVLSIINIVNHYPWLFGAISGVLMVAGWHTRKNILFRLICFLFLLSSLVHPGIYFAVKYHASFPIAVIYSFDEYILDLHFLSLIFVSLISFFLYRWVRVKVDLIKTAISKRTQLEKEGRSDIRTKFEQSKSLVKSYKPEKYFKSNRLFLGLDRKSCPVYMPSVEWREKHVDLIGPTGTGKSLIAASLLYQSSLQGGAIDPKDDEFLPHVLASLASKQNKRFHYIDLNGDVPQVNPILNKTPSESFEIFCAGFGLSDKGDAADFYRVQDRAAARELSAKLASCNSLLGAYQLMISEGSMVSNNATKFHSDMNEVLALRCLSNGSGIDLKQAIEKGDVIYIKGTIRNPAILRLQKILLLSIMQFCEKRNKDEARDVAIFLDEFKYLISKPSLEALGALRDKRAHVILAHQSMGDLRDCPNDIDPESVLSSVMVNCNLKIIYRVNDPQTAEWLTLMSGNIQIEDESRVFHTDSLAETKGPERRLKQAERGLIDINTLISLPKGCAVVFGNEITKVIYTAPIMVKKDPNNLRLTYYEDKYNDRRRCTKNKAEKVFIKNGLEELINVD